MSKRGSAFATLATLASIVLLPCTLLPAQTTMTGGASDMSHQLPAIWVGAGLAAGSGNTNSSSLATAVGGLFLAAVELPMRQTFGPASVALRVEGRWSQQSLDAVTGSGTSGDVQTLGGGVALRVFPVVANTASPRRITPYLLAGVGMARQSTRVAVSISDPDMPTARFSQTSSEVSPSALGGVGALFRIGRAALFAEARTEFSRRNAGTRHSSFGAVGMAFQPHR